MREAETSVICFRGYCRRALPDQLWERPALQLVVYLASSLSKLALSAGSAAGELWEGRIRLAEGGGVNLYWSAG